MNDDTSLHIAKGRPEATRVADEPSFPRLVPGSASSDARAAESQDPPRPLEELVEVMAEAEEPTEGEYDANTRIPRTLSGDTPSGNRITALEEEILEIRKHDFQALSSKHLKEFRFQDGRHVVLRTLYAIERDVLNWYCAVIALLRRSWGFDSFVVMTLALGSTTFFSLYRDEFGARLAARLDFSIVGAAFVFPITFLIAETFRRRETVLQRVASMKALACNVCVGLLLWRWYPTPSAEMGEAWSERVPETILYAMSVITAILELPSWSSTRHGHTKQGQAFREKVIARERDLTKRLGVAFGELHIMVEDLKRAGLPATEASRINQYLCHLQIDFEALLMMKCYRTPAAARSFVRVMALVCPVFWGPYFAYVASNTNIGFAIALCALSVMVLIGLVKVHRSLEDPFVSRYHGDVVNLKDERNDLMSRLQMISVLARMRRVGGS